MIQVVYFVGKGLVGVLKRSLLQVAVLKFALDAMELDIAKNLAAPAVDIAELEVTMAALLVKDKKDKEPQVLAPVMVTYVVSVYV